jgi:hypothetical protein
MMPEKPQVGELMIDPADAAGKTVLFAGHAELSGDFVIVFSDLTYIELETGVEHVSVSAWSGSTLAGHFRPESMLATGMLSHGQAQHVSEKMKEYQAAKHTRDIAFHARKIAELQGEAS